MGRSRQGFSRWLVGAWPLWLMALVLLSGLFGVIQPRLAAFVDAWYSVPADSLMAETAGQLHTARLQLWWQQIQMIAAAPLGLLLLLALFGARRSGKEEDLPNTLADLPVSSTGLDKTIAYDAPRHDAETTQVRDTTAAKSSADRTLIRNTALDTQNALLIGPNGRYRVERLLASGGMGSVHMGFDQVLQRKVAIKELDVALSGDEEQTGRFRQEALALAGLAHPYIVPVYDLIEDDNRFWIVMELLPGGDLDQRIANNPPNVKTAINIIKAIAEGLAFAHNKGIVHRDIKPMNILFNSDGIPKLVDFGIAKLVQSQQSVVQTRDGLSLGSPTYMSPEQAEGKKDVDARADIYALGITFYKVLTGAVPFTGDVGDVLRQQITAVPRPPREINPQISPELEVIVLKMLEKKPVDRFQTLEDFAVALDAVKNG